MSLYAPNGAIYVTAVSGAAVTGLYSIDGAWNVVIDGAGSGLYHPCGALNVTTATGTSPLPRYAPDGSLYIQEAPYTLTGPVSINTGRVLLVHFINIDTDTFYTPTVAQV